MKTASNLLIVQNGLALSVSRRNDPTRWGLPGGKVDLGETSQEAAIRETREETGVIVYRHEVTPILSARSVGDVNFWTTTYLYIGEKVFTDNEIIPEEGLYVKWQPLADLADPNISPFAEYNKWVLAHYKQYMEETNGS
jgi:8-oxo-dGTP pyrophosphatase MutT (NUDIX family)